MKVSIIIPVLNSHEIVRRQILHFEKIGIPDDTEVIIVDDGSDPPLKAKTDKFALTVFATNDSRPWTWALARNQGARIARGEYMIMFDVDHIITRELIDMVRTFGGQKVQFEREFGLLLPSGEFTQDIEALIAYGFPSGRLEKRGLRVPPLPNNFAMRKDVFWALGGYREDLVERAYPQGEDRLFKKAWHDWMVAGNGHVHTERPIIYMFPNGKFCGDVDFNPYGLFHTLTRKTNRNPFWKRQRCQTSL